MMEPSGPLWVTRFPGSKSISDLEPLFRGHVQGFVDALHTAGATVTISATYRPPERAYLMHWCCLIADSGQDPEHIPHIQGVDIDWSHGGDRVAAKSAAKAMKAAYGIAYPAALISRHTQRVAIDMTVSWLADLSIKSANGAMVKISSFPRTGDNPNLWKVGSGYGVVKLPSDRPHWSSDGH